MIFDSHAHYDDKKFSGMVDETIAHITQQGVSKVMNASYDLNSIVASYELTKKYEMFYAAAGIHPGSSNGLPANYLETIAEYIAKEKVQAIGEIGLDYHYDFCPQDIQKKVFAEQLDLAKQLDKPVIIHNRDSHDDMLKMLKEFKPRGVVHCFSGSAELAKEFNKLDLYIGFTGVITFKNARKAIEAMEQVPLDRLLIETDCPYMAPEPVRGTVNHSGNLVHIAEKIAEIKNMPTSEILKITYDNAMRCYEI